MLISPKMGVGAMLLAFGVVVGTFLTFGVQSGGSRGDPASEPAAEPPEGADAGPAGVEPLDALAAAQDELRAWFQSTERKPINDRAAVDEDEWIEHLLLSDTRRAIDRVPSRVFPDLTDLARVQEEPGSHRGTLVRVWGQVQRVDRLDLLEGAAGRMGWRFSIIDADGVPWVATCAAQPPESVGTDSWVKVYGAFVKLRPSEDRPDPALHVFSTRPAVASFPPVTYEEPRVEWLTMIRDGDRNPEESELLEEVPFYGMLNYVRHLGPEGYARMRDSGELKVRDMTGPEGATDLAKRPQVHRFQPVRLRVATGADELNPRGKFHTDGLVPENHGNIDSVYQGYVIDDQMRTIWFISPFPEETFAFDNALVVEVEGFFYKRRHVEAEDGKRFWMPVLIGTAIRPLVMAEPEKEMSPEMIGGIAAGASLLMLVVFVVSVVRARGAAEATRQRLARRAARRVGHGGPGA